MTDSALFRSEPSRCETLMIRGLRYNLRRWGAPDAPPILCLHGNHDSSITFQFLADYLAGNWSIVAPDWRGHGDTEWASGEYWLHDFLADLDALTTQLFPDRAIPILGHSLGGNIASVFAGLRPDRLTHLISLDGFGPFVHRLPVKVAQTLTGYLDGLNSSRLHRPYAKLQDAADRLMLANPRLSPSDALILAEHLSSIAPDGTYQWRRDPSFNRAFLSLHTLEEWGVVWSQIRVPVYWIMSTDQRPDSPNSDPEAMRVRQAMMPNLSLLTVPGTGHNLHHEAPEQIAAAIEAFLR